MKTLLFIALFASTGCSGDLVSTPAPPIPQLVDSKQDSDVFACFDSVKRSDGLQQANIHCKIGREYCFEATGGAAFSHGANCRALPKLESNCAELVAANGAGASCVGTQASGLRVNFAFP